MQVLFDTNILFSALLVGGLERTLLETTLVKGHTLVITDLIAEELKRNIDKKYPPKIRSQASERLERIFDSPLLRIKTHKEYKPFIKQASVLIVEKDVPILAAALQPEISACVTGDSHFLDNAKLKKLREQKIFTTREFLEKIN